MWSFLTETNDDKHMEYEVYSIDDATDCIKINGRFVAKDIMHERSNLLEVIPASRDVAIDCTDMEHIDSSGLGMLVQMLQKAKNNGHIIVLAGVRHDVKIVFDITKVSRVFLILDTLDEAVSALHEHQHKLSS